MRLLVRFKPDCDTYLDSNVITLGSVERFFTDDTHDRLNELMNADGMSISLMIVEDDYSVIEHIKFDERVRTNGNLAIFSCNRVYNGEEHLITISLHNNRMDIPECPPFIELISDNTIDNICLLGRGKQGYIELIA